jgi:uncharacterized membrane protein YfcA
MDGLVLLAGALLAGCVAGASGFGAALVLQPVLLAFCQPATALVALTVSSLAANGMLVRHAQPQLPVVRRLLSLVPVGALAGVFLFSRLGKGPLQVLLGVAVIAGAGALTARGAPRRALGRIPLQAWGMVSGVLTTSVGANGPPVVIGVTSQGLEPATQRATLAAYFLLVTPLSAVSVLITGHGPSLVHGAELGLVLAPVTALGVWLGKRLAVRFTRQRFRRLTIGLVLIAGVASLAAGLR